MRTIAVIPARYDAVRFPGKPLADQTGKFLVQHVYERARQAKLIDDVIVATDDKRIASAVASFGGNCIMTRKEHPSGTDRVAEVAREVDADLYANVQGDEPEIEPASIDTLVTLMRDNNHPMGTLACDFDNLAKVGIAAAPDDPNCVKVVMANDHALYFSRSHIPHPRNTGIAPAYLHLGIYAYRREFLLNLASLAPTPLEQAEGLEQLRVLEHGFSIAVGLVKTAAVGIDTPADYEAFVKRYQTSSRRIEAQHG